MTLYKNLRIHLVILFLLVTALFIQAQQVDSIYFHLYTDSLKKGTYNYINVDGRLTNGRWLPLTAKEINFTASAGIFEGNSLFIDKAAAVEKLTVKAVLKSNPALVIATTIYIKKMADDEPLKTAGVSMQPVSRRKANQ